MELSERTKRLEGVHTVRLLFCDAAGIRRARAIPISGGGNDQQRRQLQALLRDGVGLTQGAMGMPAHADIVAPESGLSAVGEVRLVPGRASRPGASEGPPPPPPPRAVALVRPLPWGPPGHAVAVADMLDAGTSEPWSCCPRAALRRVAAAARRDFGVAFTVGFELEFVLLSSCAQSQQHQQQQQQQQQPFVPPGPSPSFTSGWCAADDLAYASSLALDAHAELLAEAAACCAALGQPVVQYHSESAPGQYELALAAAHPGDPVAAADGLLLAKEAIACVAARRGFFACFAPKPFAGAAGSGMHAHVSVVSAEDPGGVNLMMAAAAAAAAHESGGEGAGGGGGATAAGGGPLPPLPLSPLGEAFVAGLLAHLPALLPFTAPSAGSYERLKPGCWAGAFSTYGVEDREAPLRITAARGAADGSSGSQASAGGKTNVEVKAVDATANPHVALAAILTAGIMGLRTKARLPPPPPPPDAALAAEAPPLPPSAPVLLPASLPEALAALEADAAFVAALRDPRASLGGPLYDALVGVRKCEARLGVTPAQTALRY